MPWYSWEPAPRIPPGLYSIMSHVDMNLGVYYPRGGIHAIVQGLLKLCEEQGVRFLFDTEVKSILVRERNAVGGTHDAGGCASR